MSEINSDPDNCGNRNFNEDEILTQAKIRHYNSECYRPSFLIRIHNLEVKRDVSNEAIRASNFHRQDLTINIRRGKLYSLGQSERFNKYQQEREILENYEQEYDTFINLFRKSFNPYLSDKHCEFFRDLKNDKTLIKDLNSKKGTFVNSSRLHPLIHYELKDGDIVSFGLSHLDPDCKLDNEFFWVFKYKEVPEEEESHFKDLCSQVFENHLILSKILHRFFINYKLCPHFIKGLRLELTRIRSVSKFWNTVSIPILREDFELSLTINQGKTKRSAKEKEIHMDPKECMIEWNQNFDKKTALFSCLGLKKLIITDEFKGWLGTEIREAELKLFEKFFCHYGNQILEITLRFEIGPQNERHKIREKVLQSLFKGCKSAKKFWIIEDCSKSLANVEPSTSTTSLVILCDEIASYKNLLNCFPNVAKIWLRPRLNGLKQFFQFTGNPENKAFVKDALKNLRVLKILGPQFLEDDNGALINAMKAFPVKIEEFIMGYLKLEETPTVLISDMISTFANNLKIVRLAFDCLSEKMFKAGLRFPKMEKLEMLEIGLHHNDVKIWNFELGGFPNLKVINVKSNLGADVECESCIFLEYLLCQENRQHFPKLEKAFISYGQLQSKNFVCWDLE